MLKLLEVGYCVMMFPSMYNHIMGTEMLSIGMSTGAEGENISMSVKN